MTVHDHL